jgi:hypothetical protein
MPSPTQWQQARVTASFQAGEMLRGQIDVPSLQPIDAKAQVGGTIDVADLLRLLPARLPGALAGLNLAASNGRVEINASASFSPQIGVRIGELTIRGVDLAVPAV